MSIVTCAYCGERARLVRGTVIYPHRADLHDKQMWHCEPCKAWVGCHPGTITPLGRLADAELRAAKMDAHAAFDPIWQARHQVKSAADPTYKKHHARGGRYKALAQAMGIPQQQCHIGMFDVQQCRRVVEICQSGALS